MKQLYQVVTTGKLLPQHDYEQVIKSLAAIFKTSAKKAEYFIQSEVKIIKKDLEKTVAEKYMHLLQQAGLEVYIELQNAVRNTHSSSQEIKSSAQQDHHSVHKQSWKIGILVFMGTLFGSLLGVAADYEGITDTVDRIKQTLYPKLYITGSDTILGEELGMIQDWKEEFEKENNVKLIIDAIGSTNGVKKAAGGDVVNILAMSAPMSDTHYTTLTKAGIEVECAGVIGFDVIIFVTGLDASVSALRIDQISNILNGIYDNWAQLGGKDYPIRVLKRPGSGTTKLVLERLLPPEGVPANDSHYLECYSNAHCLNRALEIGGGFLWSSASWLKTQPEYFRVVPIKTISDAGGISPMKNKEDVLKYPSQLVRPLYLYVLLDKGASNEQTMLAKDFMHYIRSVHGQQILEQYEFFTFFRRPTEVQVELPPGFAELAVEDKICKN